MGVQVQADISDFSQAQDDHTAQLNSTDMETNSEMKLTNSSESLIQQLLIAVQNMRKCADKFVELTTSEDEDNALLKSGHISPLLTSQLHSHVKCLDMQSITTSVDNIVEKFRQLDTSLNRDDK